ncbi:MAG: hypothetical protein A2286_00385 [Gammaproteobacteria bacterium RIFOXYA12_FULL_61_12]|nr:MAG: hypothetical protein A2286_00385 [Gammaproteobacteria bacterium RIFOXYA12_FULL_61_12]
MPLLPSQNPAAIPQARAFSNTESVPACGVAMGDLAGYLNPARRTLMIVLILTACAVSGYVISRPVVHAIGCR